jgi:hypothetical protein
MAARPGLLTSKLLELALGFIDFERPLVNPAISSLRPVLLSDGRVRAGDCPSPWCYEGTCEPSQRTVRTLPLY